MATGSRGRGNIHAERVLRNPEGYRLSRDRRRADKQRGSAGKCPPPSKYDAQAAAALYKELRDKYCQAFDVPLHKLLTSTTRPTRSGTLIRSLIAMDMRKLGGSFPVIGDGMGINHTNVLRAVRRPREEVVAELIQRMDANRRTVAVMAERDVCAWLKQVEMDSVQEDLRSLWDASIAAYKAAPPEQRGELWRQLCRAMFPHSHEAQAKMLPRVAA